MPSTTAIARAIPPKCAGNISISTGNSLPENFLINDRETRNKLLTAYNAAYRVQQLSDVHNLSSFDLLLRYLANPDSEMWSAYALVQWLLLLNFRRFKVDETTIRAFQDALINKEDYRTSPPLALQSSPGGEFLCTLYERDDSSNLPLIRLFACGREEAIRNNNVKELQLFARLFDEPALLKRSEFPSAWSGFLRLYNFYQHLPSSFFVSTRGIANGEYKYSIFEPLAETAPVAAAEIADPLLEALKEISDPAAHSLLEYLSRPQLPLPEAGYELCDRGGRVIAEAEFAWEKSKVALLRQDQKPHLTAFQAAGWKVFLLDEYVQNPGEFVQSVSLK